MNVSYWPFTCLSASTARSLFDLLGTFVVYQPLLSAVPKEMAALSDEGLVEILAPGEEEQRLKTALAEFREWARLNPVAATAGADFLGSRQGDIPFFDDSAVNKIRTDIQRYGRGEGEQRQLEAVFGARLFLSVAQENDLLNLRLYRDVKRFDDVEKAFFASLDATDEGSVRRASQRSFLWHEDQGAKQTGQRIRAWASLAAMGRLPEILVTTSTAVMAYLIEMHKEALQIEKVATLFTAESGPLLSAALSKLARQSDLTPGVKMEARLPTTAGPTQTSDRTVAVYAALRHRPEDVIRHLAPHVDVQAKPVADTTPSHTLFLHVKIE